MSPIPLRGVTVNRMRIRARLDPVTARLRVGWLLDESTMHPPGLPPSAILCIRRLKDPRPGTIGLGGAQLPPRNWSELLAASIAALARRAARPYVGDVADDAEAVMFADRAELLACLAADWCAGRLASRWWARELLKDLGDRRALLRAWLESPAHIAAALDLLDERGDATAFVARLSRSDCHALADAIVVHHGLRSLVPALEALDRDERRPILAGSRAHRAAEGDRQSAAEGVPPAPWAACVRESAARVLGADQECLLGITVTIRRAPATARSAQFADEVRRWWIDNAGDAADAGIADPHASGAWTRLPVARSLAAPHVHDDAERSSDHTRDRASTPTAAPPKAIDAGDAREETSRPPTSSIAHLSTGRETEPAAIEGQARYQPRWSADRETSSIDVDEPRHRGSQHPPARPSAAASSTKRLPMADGPTTVAQAGASVSARLAEAHPCSTHTQLGGVFYLLNVAIGLGLYGDFTTPMARGLDVSIWDFLAIAGRRLTPRRYHEDAVWALLADLAGHPGEDARDQDVAHGSTPWMRWLVPCIRARLTRAGGDLSRRRAGELLCLHRATVLTTSTHVDVMFALADLPIAIRLSGLDRNPGWIPAADRIVALHYD